MDERLRFVARLLEGEKMAVLCREFDISRKTGYKIFSRYKDCGLEGLTDRSRRPYRQGSQLPFQIENADPAAQARASELGRTEDPREDPPQAQRDPTAGDQHRARGAGSPRPGQPAPPQTLQGRGHRPVASAAAQRSVVRRLQGRVHAGRQALLLSADHHRFGQPLPVELRGALEHQGAVRFYRI